MGYGFSSLFDNRHNRHRIAVEFEKPVGIAKLVRPALLASQPWPRCNNLWRVSYNPLTKCNLTTLKSSGRWLAVSRGELQPIDKVQLDHALDQFLRTNMVATETTTPTSSRSRLRVSQFAV